MLVCKKRNIYFLRNLSNKNIFILESLAYITMQTIAKIVSTTGCAAITPFNFHKLFKSITTGINRTIFLIIVIIKDFTATPNA